MAIPVQPLLIGADVSKATLAICLGPDQPGQNSGPVILARKLARVAFALLKNQSEYQPRYLKEACMET